MMNNQQTINLMHPKLSKFTTCQKAYVVFLYDTGTSESVDFDTFVNSLSESLFETYSYRLFRVGYIAGTSWTIDTVFRKRLLEG